MYSNKYTKQCKSGSNNIVDKQQQRKEQHKNEVTKHIMCYVSTRAANRL